MKNKFKTLMYLGVYVDVNLLSKGIYEATKPFIYDHNETIENMVNKGRNIKDLTGSSFIEEQYFENLKKCKLVEITITLSDIQKNNKSIPPPEPPKDRILKEGEKPIPPKYNN